MPHEDKLTHDERIDLIDCAAQARGSAENAANETEAQLALTRSAVFLVGGELSVLLGTAIQTTAIQAAIQLVASEGMANACKILSVADGSGLKTMAQAIIEITAEMPSVLDALAAAQKEIRLQEESGPVEERDADAD